MMTPPPAAAPPPSFRVAGPDSPVRPAIVAVPHAGRFYPPEVRALARVDLTSLRRLEDRYVDRLADLLPEAGFTVMIAEIARAVIDLNRGEEEWDQQAVDAPVPGRNTDARVRAGLGLVPVRLHGAGDLWRRRLTPAELDSRIRAHHRPWHDAVAERLEAAREGFGAAVLIDLHSMPRQPGGRPQFVVGNRHGATASARLVDQLMAAAEGAGLSVARNAPYAGAHGVARHGDPRRGVEAVQIEFDRSLYLDARGEVDEARAGAMAALVRRLAGIAADHTGDAALPVAAE